MKAFALTDLPAHLHEQVINALAPRLRDAQPKQDAQLSPLGKDKDEEGGARRARVRITRFGARLLDADNCAGSIKWILDSCRMHHLIRDDDPASIILEVHQVKAKKSDRGTLIEITQL